MTPVASQPGRAINKGILLIDTGAAAVEVGQTVTVVVAIGDPSAKKAIRPKTQSFTGLFFSS